jgi:hypothetical protein
MGGDVDMAVGREEGDQDHQGAGYQGRLAGSIQPWDWLLRSEILAFYHHRSQRDPNRSSDSTYVLIGLATVELRIRGAWRSPRGGGDRIQPFGSYWKL